jgi:glycosyltransferase involved in cell wall biosynthesis
MSRNDASIVIPVRNAPIRRLQACLDAVLVSRRYCGKPIEVILVDDYSRDDKFAEYAAFVATRYGGIRILRLNEWKGIGGARNAGAMCAESDWLIFIDSDDTITANCLAELLRHREALAFVYSNNVKISESQVKLYDRLSLFRIFEWALQHRRYNQLPILYSNHICMPYMLHRRVFGDIGGYAEKVYSGEHVGLAAKIIKSGLIRNYVYIDQVLYHYRPSIGGNHYGNAGAHVSGKEAAFLNNSRLFGLEVTRYEVCSEADDLPALYLPHVGATPIIPAWAVASGGKWKLNREHESLRAHTSRRGLTHRTPH